MVSGVPHLVKALLLPQELVPVRLAAHLVKALLLPQGLVLVRLAAHRRLDRQSPQVSFHLCVRGQLCACGAD